MQAKLKSLARSPNFFYTKTNVSPMKKAIYCLAACFSSTVALTAPTELTYWDFLGGAMESG